MTASVKKPGHPGAGDAAQETVWFALREMVTEFLGYETESAEGIVAALVKDGKEVSELVYRIPAPWSVDPDAVLCESGGQVGDTVEVTARACAQP